MSSGLGNQSMWCLQKESCLSDVFLIVRRLGAKNWCFPRKRSYFLYYWFLFIIIIHYIKALLSFLLFIGEKDLVFPRKKKLVATFSLRLLLCTARSHNTISPTTKLFSNSTFFGKCAKIVSKYQTSNFKCLRQQNFSNIFSLGKFWKVCNNSSRKWRMRYILTADFWNVRG